jgi:hypothetical protein
MTATKRLPLLLALPLLAVAVWWLWPAATPEPAPLARVQPTPAPTTDSPSAPLPPDKPAEPAPVAQPEPPPPAVVADPQLDLQAALADMTGLLRTGDYASYVLHYTPPSTFAKQAAKPDVMRRLMEAASQGGVPGTSVYQNMQQMIQILELAQDGKLFLKVKGDTVTYTLTDDPVARVVLSFVRIDGKWYLGQGLW